MFSLKHAVTGSLGTGLEGPDLFGAGYLESENKNPISKEMINLKTA